VKRSLVLGIDAAWTEKGTSGVALMSVESDDKQIIAANSSYSDFAPNGAENTAQRLLRAAATIGGAAVDVVAIDMPIARYGITGRREADNTIARTFARYGASTHSPSEARPGYFGRNLYLDFVREGYEIATDRQAQGSRAIIEVFPLAALVRLMHAATRPTYKVVKAKKYWPELTVTQSIEALLDQWRSIAIGLAAEISYTGIDIPDACSVKSRASLKPYEDKLDAIVCAWVGACYLEGRAEPFGDANAAIWVPLELSLETRSIL
jgi:predicted RNase H-like nuclease